MLIGEMRDLETIEAALTIAETGHLCFGTLHTNSASRRSTASSTSSRAYQQPQIRALLSFVLEGVLVAVADARSRRAGRALALEVMVPTPAIRNLIREDKIHQIYSQMQIGQSKFGMQTVNQSLCCARHRRSRSRWRRRSSTARDPDELKNMIAERRRHAAGTTAAATSRRARRLRSYDGRVRMGRPRARRRESRKGAMEAEAEPRGRQAAARAGHHAAKVKKKARTSRSSCRSASAGRAREGPRHLHAPVRDDDRRRPAHRAVPRHPRGADRRTRSSRTSLGDVKAQRRAGRHVHRRAAQHPQGLRRPLRQPRPGRRGRRHPRHDPEPPRGLHREGDEAEAPGPGRDGLPVSIVVVVVVVVLVDPARKVIPVFENMFKDFGGRTSCRADADRHRHLATRFVDHCVLDRRHRSSAIVVGVRGDHTDHEGTRASSTRSC